MHKIFNVANIIPPSPPLKEFWHSDGKYFSTEANIVLLLIVFQEVRTIPRILICLTKKFCVKKTRSWSRLLERYKCNKNVAVGSGIGRSVGTLHRNTSSHGHFIFQNNTTTYVNHIVYLLNLRSSSILYIMGNDLQEEGGHVYFNVGLSS